MQKQPCFPGSIEPSEGVAVHGGLSGVQGDQLHLGKKEEKEEERKEEEMVEEKVK